MAPKRKATGTSRGKAVKKAKSVAAPMPKPNEVWKAAAVGNPGAKIAKVPNEVWAILCDHLDPISRVTWSLACRKFRYVHVTLQRLNPSIRKDISLTESPIAGTAGESITLSSVLRNWMPRSLKWHPGTMKYLNAAAMKSAIDEEQRKRNEQAQEEYEARHEARIPAIRHRNLQRDWRREARVAAEREAEDRADDRMAQREENIRYFVENGEIEDEEDYIDDGTLDETESIELSTVSDDESESMVPDAEAELEYWNNKDQDSDEEDDRKMLEN